MGITGGLALFLLGPGDNVAVPDRDRVGGLELRRGAVPAAGDPGRRDRLRRAPHRQAPRGAVSRALGAGAEVHRDPERVAAARAARLARLSAQPAAVARGAARDPRGLRAHARRRSRSRRSSSPGASRSARRCTARSSRAIAAHGRGETAVDPLTNQLLAPPADRDVDEGTSWFLDYFSVGELRRVLSRGAHGALVRRAARRGALARAHHRPRALGDATSSSATGGNPGPLAVIAIVIAGFALTDLRVPPLAHRPGAAPAPRADLPRR